MPPPIFDSSGAYTPYAPPIFDSSGAYIPYAPQLDTPLITEICLKLDYNPFSSLSILSKIKSQQKRLLDLKKGEKITSDN